MAQLSATKHKTVIGMDQEELEAYVIGLGLEKFRAKQIYKWIYSKSVRDLVEMTDLAAKTRDILQNHPEALPIGALTLVSHELSSDGTQKFLFKTHSGDLVESVLMRFEDRDSLSACISSQVGCKVKCPFCATGTLGYKTNLSAAEIIDQVLFIQNISKERIANIVYMGQGEPLDNYDEVLSSIHKLRNQVGIGVRHITVSTSGVIPKILELAETGLQITLALSLHDPTNEGRDYLVPINKKWPIFELIEAMKAYVAKTNRRVTIEYVLLDGINDSEEKAKILGNLVKGLHCNINLIPYNDTQTNPKDSYKPEKHLIKISDSVFRRSKSQAIRNFANTLKRNSAGKTVTVRRERGHDINAACGQLANKMQ